MALTLEFLLDNMHGKVENHLMWLLQISNGNQLCMSHRKIFLHNNSKLIKLTLGVQGSFKGVSAQLEVSTHPMPLRQTSSAGGLETSHILCNSDCP